MPFTYLCPKCRSNLNPNVRVVLVARFDGRKGVVLMSAQLGDFKFIADKGFYSGVKKGEKLEFFCPVCAESLTSPAQDHFTELLLVNRKKPDQEPCILRFSRISDEHATFVYDGDSVKEFGEDAGLFHRQMVVEGEWTW